MSTAPLERRLLNETSGRCGGRGLRRDLRVRYGARGWCRTVDRTRGDGFGGWYRRSRGGRRCGHRGNARRNGRRVDHDRWRRRARRWRRWGLGVRRRRRRRETHGDDRGHRDDATNQVTTLAGLRLTRDGRRARWRFEQRLLGTHATRDGAEIDG